MRTVLNNHEKSGKNAQKLGYKLNKQQIGHDYTFGYLKFHNTSAQID